MRSVSGAHTDWPPAISQSNVPMLAALWANRRRSSLSRSFSSMTASLTCSGALPRNRFEAASALVSMYSRSPTTSASTSPLRIARKVSSASASRARNSAFSMRSDAGISAFIGVYPRLRHVQIEAEQDALGLRQIADDFFDRFGQFPHECRDGQNLIVGGEPGVFQQVNHFDLISPDQALIAEAFEIGERGDGLRGPVGDVEPQFPFGFDFVLSGMFG